MQLFKPNKIKKNGIEISIENKIVNLKYFFAGLFCPRRFDITGLTLSINPTAPIVIVITIALATLIAPSAIVEYLPAMALSDKLIKI